MKHQAYLRSQVFLPGHGDGPPRAVDPRDHVACPETFRQGISGSPFAAADRRLDLIRVEELRFVARFGGATAERLRELARKRMAGHLGGGEQTELEDILGAWAFGIEVRPVFAAFWEDVRDLFGARAAADPPDWADALRDRLGLAHLDPGWRKAPGDAARGSIEVLVFRYPVAVIPRLLGRRGVRPLVAPTVLDGAHSPAFCPAPPGDPGTGHTVDLGARSELPRREILHPTVAFQATHVWRIGTIRRAIPHDILPVARGMHLVQIREANDRPDYATGTDGDLL
jgi:hypothetical protein